MRPSDIKIGDFYKRKYKGVVWKILKVNKPNKKRRSYAIEIQSEFDGFTYTLGSFSDLRDGFEKVEWGNLQKEIQNIETMGYRYREEPLYQGYPVPILDEDVDF